MASGLLNLAGFDIGKHINKGDFSNSKGYFENAKLQQFNDKLFADLYTNWYNSLIIPDQWWKKTEIKNQQPLLEGILKDEFQSSSAILIKDPRISILYPIYAEVLKKLKIDPSFIICTRDPGEVAASLKTRNNLAYSRSCLLWADHNLKAEIYSRGFPRIFLHYDDILKNPVENIEQVLDHFSFDKTTFINQAKNMNSFADKKLKHHTTRIDTEITNTPPEISDLLKILVSLNGKDSNNDTNVKFDILRTSFYRHLNFFQGVDDTNEAMLEAENISFSRESHKRSIHAGLNRMKFTIQDKELLRRFFFRPATLQTAFVLKRYAVINHDNNETMVSLHYNNRVWTNNENLMVFESDMPEMIFFLHKPQRIKTILLDIVYFTFGETTSSFGFKQRNLKDEQMAINLQDLKSEKEQKVSEIEKLKDEIREQIASFNKKNEKITGALNFDIKTLKSEISSIQEQHQQEISENQREIDLLNKSMMKLKREYNNNLEAKQGEIQALTDENSDLRREYNKTIRNNILEINLLSQDIKDKETRFKQVVADKEQHISTLTGKIEILNDSYNNRISKLQQRIVQLNNIHKKTVLSLRLKIHEKDRYINQIFYSLTWRIGNVVLWPAKFVFKLFKK